MGLISIAAVVKDLWLSCPIANVNTARSGILRLGCSGVAYEWIPGGATPFSRMEYMFVFLYDEKHE